MIDEEGEVHINQDGPATRESPNIREAAQEMQESAMRSMNQRKKMGEDLQEFGEDYF